MASSGLAASGVPRPPCAPNALNVPGKVGMLVAVSVAAAVAEVVSTGAGGIITKPCIKALNAALAAGASTGCVISFKPLPGLAAVVVPLTAIASLIALTHRSVDS